MFSKNSYYLKSGIYTIFERIFTLIFSIGAVFIIFRKLTVEEAGIWVQFISVTGLLELARNGLIQNGLVKFLNSSDKILYPRILSSSLFLNFFLTCINILFLLTFSTLLAHIWHAPVLEDMFHLYVLTTILLIPFYHFQFIEQANFSFKGIFYSNLVKQIMFFGTIAISYFGDVEIGLMELVKFQMISIASGSLTSFIMTRHFLVFEKKFDWEWIKKLFNYGKYVFGTNISHVLFVSIDQMMLGHFKGNNAAGLYNVAIRVSNVVDVPSLSVASIIFPQSAKKMHQDGRAPHKGLYEKSVGLIIGLILPISILFFFVPEFPILVVAGEKYRESIPILKITIFYTLIAPFTRQFGTILDSTGNPGLNFYFTLGGAIVNIILNYFLINLYGVLGAAYATLSTYLLMFIFSQIVLSKTFNVNTFNIITYGFWYYKEGFRVVMDYFKKIGNNKIFKTNNLN